MKTVLCCHKEWLGVFRWRVPCDPLEDMYYLGKPLKPVLPFTTLHRGVVHHIVVAVPWRRTMACISVQTAEQKPSTPIGWSQQDSSVVFKYSCQHPRNSSSLIHSTTLGHRLRVVVNTQNHRLPLQCRTTQ